MSRASITNKETLKMLESQLAQLEGERTGLRSQVDSIQSKLTLNKNSIHLVKTKIYDLTKPYLSEVQCSEHALLRYCERVLGINLQEAKTKILNEKLISTVNVLGGTGVYPVEDFKVKMVDKMIVTIIKD